MRKFLEKNSKNVILRHIVFCIVVFQQSSFTCDLHDALNQEKQQLFWFLLKSDFSAILEKSHFLKKKQKNNNNNFIKTVLKLPQD